MTQWFTRNPEDSLTVYHDGESNALILTDGPDRVRTPTELGDKELRVLRVFMAPCPVTKALCRHLELEDGLFVAQSNQFYWYRHELSRNKEGKR